MRNIKTAKANGADTYYYLKYLLETAPKSPELEVSDRFLEDLMPWSESYRRYEAKEKEELIKSCVPPSDKEPTGKKLMKYVA